MRKLTTLFLSLAMAGVATQVPALSATQTIEKEATVIGDDGTSRIVRTPANKVVPGERVVYTLNFTNDDTQPARDLILTMPVPSEVAFIEGTAEKTGAIVTYSADNGDSFAERQATIKMDINGTVRPAQAADITHIRWNVAGPVAAGENGKLSFSGVLK